MTGLLRRDEYIIGSNNSARASFSSDGKGVRMFIDNIWRDTQNFEDFVEGLNIIYLTELLCINHKRGNNYSWTLCSHTNKIKNNCVFLHGAKKVFNSNYTLFIND